MATTRGWNLRGNVANAIDYILDLSHGEEKTDEGRYTYTSYNDETPLTSAYRMRLDSLNFKSDRVGYHFQFSLAPGEGTPEECLRLAKEWIDSITNGKVDYVMAVHNDTRSLHAHIVTSPLKRNGKQWKIFWKRDHKIFRRKADDVCRQNGYSVLEQTAEKGMPYYEWMNDRQDTNREALKKILETLIPKVKSYDSLKQYLEKIGFKVYDDQTKSNQTHFEFTADIKLIKEQPDQSFIIRIPYQRDHIHVDKEELEWLKKGKTARICIPIDKLVKRYDENHLYQGTIDVECLKKKFEEKNDIRTRKGLRIKVPGSKRVIRTRYLDKDKDYSLDGIKKQIKKNGRLVDDPNIEDFLNMKAPSFADVQNEKSRIFQQAEIHVGFNQSTIYRSLKQENYFNWRSEKMAKKIDALKYQKLLQKDRKNITLLEQRRDQLRQELKECYALISEVDQKIETMEKDRMENVIKMSEKEMDEYISENKAPLEARHEKLRDMIRLYSQRIDTVKNEQQLSKEAQERAERVR